MRNKSRQRGLFSMGLIVKLVLFLLFLAMLPAILAGLIRGSLSGQKLTVNTKVVGVTIGFFNGVNVDKSESELHVKNIRSRFGDKTPSDHPIQYQLFYNDSYGLMLDLVEIVVITQMIAARAGVDLSSCIEKKMEINEARGTRGRSV